MYVCNTDYILCRQCGSDVASADAVVNLRSPAAVSRTNESLFGVDKVDIQTLVNPLHINFRVFTVLEASCVTRGRVSINSNRSPYFNLRSWGYKALSKT